MFAFSLGGGGGGGGGGSGAEEKQSDQDSITAAAAAHGTVTLAQEELIKALDPKFFASEFDSVSFALEVRNNSSADIVHNTPFFAEIGRGKGI